MKKISWKKKLTDLKFWTSTLALISLVIQTYDPSIHFGHWEVVIKGFEIYLVQWGILHDYKNKTEGE
jgi:hypothetical protein